MTILKGMNMKGKVIIILVIFVASIALYLTPSSHTSSLIAQSTGRLKGKVMSFYGVPISGIPILIEGETEKDKWELISDKDGHYEIDLPSGIYQISTKRMPNLLPFCRAPFRVEAGGISVINVLPLPSIEDAECVVCATSSGIIPCPPVKDPILNYEVKSIPNSMNSPLDILIQYNEKKEFKNIIEYGVHKVMITYNTLTILGNKVKLDKRNFQLEALGEVIIEDGEKRLYAKELLVDLKATNPIISIELDSNFNFVNSRYLKEWGLNN